MGAVTYVTLSLVAMTVSLTQPQGMWWWWWDIYSRVILEGLPVKWLVSQLTCSQ
jgi:hypothetical protein